MADVVQFPGAAEGPNPVDQASKILQEAKIPFALLLPIPDTDFDQVAVTSNLNRSAFKLTVTSAMINVFSTIPPTLKEAPDADTPQKAV